MYRRNPDVNACAEFFILHYRTIAPIFRNPSFSEEREWRLLPDPETSVDANGYDGLKSFDVSVSGSMLVPYYKFPLASLGTRKRKRYLGFDTVFIGPHLHTEKLTGTVSMLAHPRNRILGHHFTLSFAI